MIQNKGKTVDSFPHCCGSNLLLFTNTSICKDIRMKEELRLSQLDHWLLKGIVIGKSDVDVDGNRMKRALSLSIIRSTSASSMIVHLFQHSELVLTFQFTGGLEQSSFSSLAIRFWALVFTTFSLVFSFYKNTALFPFNCKINWL